MNPLHTFWTMSGTVFATALLLNNHKILDFDVFPIKERRAGLFSDLIVVESLTVQRPRTDSALIFDPHEIVSLNGKAADLPLLPRGDTAVVL